MDLNKVVCATPQESQRRGRQLIANGEVVAELAANRGGRRDGAGRPKGDRTKSVLVKINDAAMERWRRGVNRTSQIEAFILSKDFKVE